MTQKTVIDFRNGQYQGSLRNHLPFGKGVFLDDDLTFIASHWVNNVISDFTLIFISHSKYFYGDWKDGVPHGINVFRSGQTIVFAKYDQGKIIGDFMVIFQKQKLVITVRNTQKGCQILSKKDNLTSQIIKQFAAQIKLNQEIREQYYQLLSFIKYAFIQEDGKVQLEVVNGDNIFGYKNGLNICFDSTYFIKSVGINTINGQIKGVGGKYNIFTNEEGDFQNKLTLKFKNNKPSNQVKKIINESHKRSINFYNNYINLNIKTTIQTIEDLLREQIINYIAQQQLTKDDLNQSLEYEPKPKNQLERLKIMRQELYKSIGKLGTQIKPKKILKQSSNNINNIQPKKNQNPQNNFNPLRRNQNQSIDPLILAAKLKYPSLEQYQASYMSPSNTLGLNRPLANLPSKYQNIQVKRERILKEYADQRNKSPNTTKFQRQNYMMKYGKLTDSPYLKFKNNVQKQEIYDRSPNNVQRRLFKYRDEATRQQLNTNQNYEKIEELKTPNGKDKSPGRRYNYVRGLNI